MESEAAIGVCARLSYRTECVQIKCLEWGLYFGLYVFPVV